MTGKSDEAEEQKRNPSSTAQLQTNAAGLTQKDGAAEDEWGNAPEDSKRLQERPAFEKDTTFYRGVMTALAWVAFIAVIGALILAAMERPIPDGMIAIGSTAVGALAGVITRR